MDVNNFYLQLAAVLSTSTDKLEKSNGFFPAAVLVPLVRQDGELTVLFEVRASHMAWQPGEICFPGGRIEPKDDDALYAAVRETSEELGIESDDIQVLGSLGEIVSPIGVRLYPFVGHIADGVQLNISQDEVAEIFMVPLNFLLTTEPLIGHMEAATRPLADFPSSLLPGYSQDWKRRTTYSVLFYQYRQHVIWGLTAQVLQHFITMCRMIKSKSPLKN
jgi:8-oxo-dGTP pyrophosphatase MutT (NUDIX family)